MGTICGYKAVLLAAETSIRIFPMMTPPRHHHARPCIRHRAGVAGLQAISTARRLGAVASPTICAPPPKSRCKAWVAASSNSPSKLRMLRTPAATAPSRTKLLRPPARTSHSRRRRKRFVITAAVIPGKKSPVLITAEMVKGMAPGSVIVDLASERGGNCELTRTGETVKAFGVTIIGAINLASSVPYNASQMYAATWHFLAYIVKEGKLQLNEKDEIIREPWSRTPAKS